MIHQCKVKMSRLVDYITGIVSKQEFIKTLAKFKYRSTKHIGVLLNLPSHKIQQYMSSNLTFPLQKVK